MGPKKKAEAPAAPADPDKENKMQREKAVFMDAANDGDLEMLKQIYQGKTKDQADKKTLLTCCNKF